MSRTKMDNLVLYLARKGKDDLRLGRTKLNKILYFIDFGHYRKTGYSVSDEEYMAIENGPVPRYMLGSFQRLEQNGALEWDEIPTGRRPTLKPVALKEPHLDEFSAEEVAFIDDIVGRFAGLTGTELADLSHSEPGYKVANEKETIPYASTFCPPYVTVTEEERKITADLAEQHGWAKKYAA